MGGCGLNCLDRLTYEPKTGNFVWNTAGSGIRIGSVAGSLTIYGYVQIKVGRRAYRAHRLAWFFSFGVWPDGEIDHINGNRLDNRLSNLRVVDRSGNSQNRRLAHKDNSSGFLGAAWNRQHQRWQSKIVANKVRHHLGYFDTPEAAHLAYMAAKARLHIDGGGH